MSDGMRIGPLRRRQISGPVTFPPNCWGHVEDALRVPKKILQRTLFRSQPRWFEGAAPAIR
jgi:hypothetical protein